MPSLSKIGDLSCINFCLVLPGFPMDTLLNIFYSYMLIKKIEIGNVGLYSNIDVYGTLSSRFTEQCFNAGRTISSFDFISYCCTFLFDSRTKVLR